MRVGTIERRDRLTGELTAIAVTLADGALVSRASLSWQAGSTSENRQRAVFNWAAIRAYWPDRHVLSAHTNTYDLALMQLDDDHPALRSRPTGMRAVYVSFLEVAPLLRTGNLHRRFDGLGPAMLSFAVTRSRQLGFSGRVSLHTIAEARTFYARLGFREVEGPEPGFNEFWESYLELPPEAADRLMSPKAED